MALYKLDFETAYDKEAGITLEAMSLRRYLEVAPVIGVSVSVDQSEPEWVDARTQRVTFLDLLSELDEVGQDPANVVAAYNVPFDLRVCRFGRLEANGETLDMRWPARVHDAMEMSMAAWPNNPGGYGLRNVAAWLNLPPKLEMSDVKRGTVSWKDYCNRDCLLLGAIYDRAVRRIAPDELYVHEMANRVRGLFYRIDPDKVAAAYRAFTENTEAGVAAAMEFFSAGGRDGEDMAKVIFGGLAEGERIRSVKAKALKNLLIETLGFDTTTTSLKKINPSKLAQRPDVAQLLTATSKTNKGLYYQKRAIALQGVQEIDMELGWFRATNTGRYSAPTSGKGVNVHNLTKKDKLIAKPLRQMLQLPEHLCFVRADAANVEYRIEGLLTGCQYMKGLFGANIEADPYGAFSDAAFGTKGACKGMPIRDVVAKAAVLGYGYGMGPMRAVEELNKAVADPINKVTVADIEKVCAMQGWKPPSKSFHKGIQTRLQCAWPIVTAGIESRDAFHAIHPEFMALADWLDLAVTKLAGAKDPERLMDYLYTLAGAPDRNLVALSIDYELEFPTVRVTVLGHSMPTVTWRHLSCSHPGIDGLGAVTANKGPRNVHRALFIENITQSAARNALVRAKLALDAQGWKHIMSVHDEILLIVPREREAVLRARADLLRVMSPKGPLGLGWAFYAKPSEATVTASLYESEDEAKIAWGKLEAGDETWRQHLT